MAKHTDAVVTGVETKPAARSRSRSTCRCRCWAWCSIRVRRSTSSVSGTGREVLVAMMEADREGLCGPKGRHQANRRAWRGGSTSSRVTLGGRQVELARLRVRSPQGEAALASFQWASATDAMDAHTLEAIAAGVSTRRYPQTLDPLPEATDEHCVSRSAVSRRFVSLSRKRMHEFLSRPLAELDIAVVFVDAKFFRRALRADCTGVDSQGTKHVLGIREGSTENAAVARALLADLVERGLPTERSVLFVIDGAKALRRAIAEVCDERAAVQRCQVHKRRNVLAHLPEHQHAQVARCLHEAFESESAVLVPGWAAWPGGAAGSLWGSGQAGGAGLSTSPQAQEQSILTVLPTSNPIPTMEPKPAVN